MRLADYLSEKGITAADFAKHIGVTYQAVHRYMRGERVPQPLILHRITLETGKRVTGDDFNEHYVSRSVEHPLSSPSEETVG